MPNTRCWAGRFEAFGHHAAMVGRASSVWCGNVSFLKKNYYATVKQRVFLDDFLTSGGTERFRHARRYWIGLHDSGLPHPLSTRSLLVALELYEHQKMCVEWHTHFSVFLSRDVPYLRWSDIIFKNWLENAMLLHVAYSCLAGYDLIFN